MSICKVQPRLVLVVEGVHDIEFLKRLSHILSHDIRSIPDLQHLETSGQVAFVTTGGSSVCPIPAAVCGLGPLEFHLYDREMSPVTELRRHLVAEINCRPNCRALLTFLRAIENYLHPDAIRDAMGIEIEFSPNHDVAAVAARALFAKTHTEDWRSISARGRRRLRARAKRWLNREAVDCMSYERLQAHDPEGEVLGWFQTIATMLDPNLPNSLKAHTTLQN